MLDILEAEAMELRALDVEAVNLLKSAPDGDDGATGFDILSSFFLHVSHWHLFVSLVVKHNGDIKPLGVSTILC